MLSKPRALITGINGFTGHYVAKELTNSGFEVYGLGNKCSDLKKCYQVNLLDANGLSNVIDKIKPEVVIHLAAIAFVAHGNIDDFYHVNIIGTRNLLAALSKHSSTIQSVLIASSANVYGNQVEGKISETCDPNPSNDYAVSKLAMEYMVKTWSDKLPLFITRPFNYTGVGQSDQFLIPKIVNHFRKKAEFIELGNIDVWRDFSDVRFVASAYRHLIQNPPIGQIINICSGTASSLREIINLCEVLSNHKIKIIINPSFIRSNEVKTLCGDPSLLNSLIKNLPPIMIEQTIRWMLEDTDIYND